MLTSSFWQKAETIKQEDKTEFFRNFFDGICYSKDGIELRIKYPCSDRQNRQGETGESAVRSGGRTAAPAGASVSLWSGNAEKREDWNSRTLGAREHMAQKLAFDQFSPVHFIILPIILPNEIHKSRRRDLRNYEKARAQKFGAKYYQGSVPFGFTLSNGQMIVNETEQKTIGLISRLKSAGHSLREIAAELKAQNIPTKNNGIWQANTVRKILLKNCAHGVLR